MPKSTTTTGRPKIDTTAAIVGYICAAVGLILILGITFCVLRRIRFRRARKYIKQQRNHSIGMGPVLTSQPPRAPWKWKEVKANIKAKRRGEERPYSGYEKKPDVSVISNGSNGVSTTNGINRPQSANSTASSLGPSHRKMHGTPAKPTIAHHVKHERLQKRREAKIERQHMKERQKEIKRDLTLLLEGKLNGSFVATLTSNGQKLPGDEFPSERPSGDSSITHVGPLRRASLQAIPNLTYLIEQSPREKPGVHRSGGLKHLDIPQNLSTLDEEREMRSSASDIDFSSRRRIASSPRRVVSEVTVHQITDTTYQDADDDITEL